MSLGFFPSDWPNALTASLKRRCELPAHSARLVRPSVDGLSRVSLITSTSATIRGAVVIVLQDMVPLSPPLLSAQRLIHGRVSMHPPPWPGRKVTRSKVQTELPVPAPVNGHHLNCL